jgi:hypothetical protein
MLSALGEEWDRTTITQMIAEHGLTAEWQQAAGARIELRRKITGSTGLPITDSRHFLPPLGPTCNEDNLEEIKSSPP